MSFQPVDPASLHIDPFAAMEKDWFLLTAGTPADCNTMTCSWGGLGVLWNKHTATAYVRHSRHTFRFMEENDIFTLSFLPEKRDILRFCGSHSGRDCDKIRSAGLTPVALEGGTAFAEAELVLVCKKRFAADLTVSELPEDVQHSFYGDNDTHKMYIGEIIACYKKA